jgi:hypothetical protein
MEVRYTLQADAHPPQRKTYLSPSVTKRENSKTTIPQRKVKLLNGHIRPDPLREKLERNAMPIMAQMLMST